MSYAEFARATFPQPVTFQPKELKWEVGAYFMRPEGHLDGGKRLRINKIEDQKIWGPDGLWTSKSECKLVR